MDQTETETLHIDDVEQSTSSGSQAVPGQSDFPPLPAKQAAAGSISAKTLKTHNIKHSPPKAANANSNTPVAATNQKFKINRLVPEIIVYGITNTKELMQSIESTLNHNECILKPINKDKLTLYLPRLEDHSSVTQMLTESNTPFYSFAPKSERPIKLIIKSVNSAYDAKDIERGIKNLDLDITILDVKLEFERDNWCKWVILVKNEDNKHNKLIGKQTICSSLVTIELFKSKELTQCKRCQRFNHTQRYCNLAFRCLKCGKYENEKDASGVVVGHAPKECPLEALKTDGKVDPQALFCCNCKQKGHTPNYKKCPKYIELRDRRNEQLTAQKNKKTRTKRGHREHNPRWHLLCRRAQKEDQQ